MTKTLLSWIWMNHTVITESADSSDVRAEQGIQLVTYSLSLPGQLQAASMGMLIGVTDRKWQFSTPSPHCACKTLSVHGTTEVSIQPQPDEAWKM